MCKIPIVKWKQSSSLWTSIDFDSRLHDLQIDFLRSRKDRI